MTNEELDLARAKCLAWQAWEGSGRYDDEAHCWHGLDAHEKANYLNWSQSVRLSDEARGLRVVPVEATEEMVAACQRAMKFPGMGDRLAPDPEGWWRAMLSASPFAPEDKP